MDVFMNVQISYAMAVVGGSVILMLVDAWVG